MSPVGLIPKGRVSMDPGGGGSMVINDLLERCA